ncbi:MAG: M28 family peptidase [Myxococcaceae bacterium]|nr:M28 family peptidase [Myxococcaceae bacterium]
MTRSVGMMVAAALLLAGCGDRAGQLDPDLRERAAAVADEVDPARVIADVKALVASHDDDQPLDCEALFNLDEVDQTRRPVCDLSRDRARELVRTRFSDLGYEPKDEKDLDAEGRFPTVNVIADLPGTDPDAGMIVIGAHYDAFFHGADDNSSGVAALMELARVLRGHSFRRQIRFIAFDLEELGLVGSTRHVALHGDEEDVRAALVFDCIGYADSTPGSQSSLPGLPVPDRGDFIALIANDLSVNQVVQIRTLSSTLEILPTETVIAPSDGAFPITGNLMRSDHAPYWLARRPAVFLTDTANFRNPNYHTDKDTVDTLDQAFLGNVTRLSAAAVAYWAEVAE